MTSVSRSRHWWAATRLLHVWQGLEQLLIDDAVDQWPTRLRACVCANDGHFVTVNLFSLYLMNFMFHTALVAVGTIQRVHYKNIKYDVLFSQVSVSTLFRWGEHFSRMCKTFSCLQQRKNYEDQTSFSRVWMCCHVFFVNHSVVTVVTVTRKHRRCFWVTVTAIETSHVS